MYITVISLIVLIIACIFAPKSEESESDYDHDINHDTIIQKGEW
jgi:hypothetical protein